MTRPPRPLVDRERLELHAASLARTARIREHDGWTRDQLEAHRAEGLARLRRHAIERSAFYRRFHAGLEDRPLHELPILSKRTFMEHWDEIVTDPDLRLDDAMAFRSALRDEPALLYGRYRVVSTSGSTGRALVTAYDREEWAWFLASLRRRFEWSRVDVGPFHPRRVAAVTALHMGHASALVGASLHHPLVRMLRLDAGSPVHETVRRLNEFRPEWLFAYARTAHLLALEQVEGRLHLTPTNVFYGAEALTDQGRADIVRAWGVHPFQTYGAVEAAAIAMECVRHRLHEVEDFVITEVVDADGRPVPPGVAGDRVLVTVLFSRTLPLIRYEIEDRVTRSPDPCDCGLPYGVLRSVEGRSQDILELVDGEGGTVKVDPLVFHDAFHGLRVDAYQVVRLTPDRVRVNVVASRRGAGLEDVERVMRDALRTAGAAPDVEVRRLDELTRTRAGKTPLVMANPEPGA